MSFRVTDPITTDHFVYHLLLKDITITSMSDILYQERPFVKAEVEP